ncbi:MAG: hypothetical protein Harvfovirus6_17 [Harvfovirus sp.]|uniref:Uncharacterized protein n=1 Tax=Harvfovirus sp. TaxID=2487768 RepID=A0A3G5A0Q0_9VIRU|nr:MAG: hypothetical protein Harvfovirus6_17 [Harvfovirus sp.]
MTSLPEYHHVAIRSSGGSPAFGGIDEEVKISTPTLRSPRSSDLFSRRRTAAAAAAAPDDTNRKRQSGTEQYHEKTKMARGDNNPCYPGETISVEVMRDNIGERLLQHKNRMIDLQAAEEKFWTITSYNKHLRAAKFYAHVHSADLFKKTENTQPCELEGEPDLIEDAIKFHQRQMIQLESIMIKIKLWKMIGTVGDISEMSVYNRFCEDLETIAGGLIGFGEVKEENKRCGEIKKYIQLIIKETRYVLCCFKDVVIPDNMDDMGIVEQFIEDLHKVYNKGLIDCWLEKRRGRIEAEMEEFKPVAKRCVGGCSACRYEVVNMRVDLGGINWRDITYFNLMSSEFVGRAIRDG